MVGVRTIGRGTRSIAGIIRSDDPSRSSSSAIGDSDVVSSDGFSTTSLRSRSVVDFDVIIQMIHAGGCHQRRFIKRSMCKGVASFVTNCTGTCDGNIHAAFRKPVLVVLPTW